MLMKTGGSINSPLENFSVVGDLQSGIGDRNKK